MPCFAATVWLPPSLQRDLPRLILELRAKWTRNDVANFRQGLADVKPMRLRLRGSPAWPISLRAPEAIRLCRDVVSAPSGLSSIRLRPLKVELYCFSCLAAKDVTHNTLYKTGKWTTLTCSKCSMSCTARKWLCHCMTSWHGCSLHAALGFSCISKARMFKRKRPDTTNACAVHTNCIPPPSVLQPTKRARHASCAALLRVRGTTNVTSPLTSHSTAPQSGRGKKRTCDQAALIAVERLREATRQPYNPHVTVQDGLASRGLLPQQGGPSKGGGAHSAAI